MIVVALSVAGLSCGGNDPATTPGPTPTPTPVPPGPTPIPPGGITPGNDPMGVESTLNQKLAPLLDSACTWTVATGTLAIVIPAGLVAVVSIKTGDPVNKQILVNNAPCPSTATITAVLAMANTLKILTVAGAGTALVPSVTNETVVFDYLNGFFALSSTTTPLNGTSIDLGGGTADSVKFRMPNAQIDTVLCGSTAANVNMCGVAIGVALHTNIPDIKAFTNVESVSFGMGDAVDVFHGDGSGSATMDTVVVATAAWAANSFLLPLDVHGGLGDDALTGGHAADHIYGDEGNDTINAEGPLSATGGGGADVFSGGAGTDTISYSARTAGLNIKLDWDGLTAVTASSGTIAVVGPPAVLAEGDTIQDDVENINAGKGDDIIVAQLGLITVPPAAAAAINNIINGDDGNDTITGGPGDDTLSGGNGTDMFKEGAVASGADVISGGAGTDTVDYGLRTLAINVTLGAGADDGDIVAPGEGDTVTVENVIGGAGNDVITGDANNNVITGGLGDDTILGGAGDDTFIEGETTVANGSDDIDGEGGFDSVTYLGRAIGVTVSFDGVANDGETGAVVPELDNIKNIERLVGTAFADVLTGSDTTSDYIEGGAGDDTLSGLGGNDQLEGGLGADTLSCGAGNDIGIGGGAVLPAVDVVDGTCELALP